MFTDINSDRTLQSVHDIISVLSGRLFSRDVLTGFVMLTIDARELSSLNPILPQGWSKRRGGKWKKLLTTVKQDAELIVGQSLYGVHCWNREWLALITSIIQTVAFCQPLAWARNWQSINTFYSAFTLCEAVRAFMYDWSIFFVYSKINKNRLPFLLLEPDFIRTQTRSTELPFILCIHY